MERGDAYKALLPVAVDEGVDLATYKEATQKRIQVVLEQFGEEERMTAILTMIKDLLDAFVAANFTGELLDSDLEEGLKAFMAGSKAARKYCLAALTVDGEVANTNVLHPELLFAANILVDVEIEDKAPAIWLWRARAHFTHQRVLSHRAHILFVRTIECYGELLKLEAREHTDTPTPLTVPSPVELHLAKGLVHHYYHEPHHSNAHLQKAHELSAMKAKLSAMMGVRTEDQTFETAQLLVRAQSSGKCGAPASAAPHSPKMIEGANVLIRPRTLKESIAKGSVLKEKCEESKGGQEDPDQDIVDTPLSALEQAVVMGLCVNVRNNNPVHGLTEEERLPYLERLLVEEKMSWAMRSQVYLLRSRMEQKRVRVRERGLLQFCELSDQWASPVKEGEGDNRKIIETSTAHRLNDFWTILYPPIFKLRTELASVYEEIGMLKSALDIHEALGNWGRVIKCCRRLDKRSKAENLIKEMLEKDKDNASLWSSLGDATRDIACYEKAWELSGHKLAAPMRGLGELYLEKENFAEAVECFDKALKLNPVYGANWFSMGWAAIKTGQWERASHCYTRNVQLDMQDGMSWSNLSTCYLQLKKHVQAYHCLIQAKKWAASDWRIIDNLYTVSVEIGEKQTAIQTLKELVESKGRNYTVRPGPLASLVKSVIAVVKGEEAASRTADELLREAIDEDTPEDNEVFDIVPFGADIELEPEDSEQAEKALEAKTEADKAKERAATSLQQSMHNLLGKITTTHTNTAELYQAFADFLTGIGSHLESFDMRLKDLRCLMKKGWQVDKATAQPVMASAQRAVDEAGLVTEEALSNRKVKTMPPKSQVLMQVQPVLKLAEDVYGTTEQYLTLKASVERLSA